jgi:hypothetical protein
MPKKSRLEEQGGATGGPVLRSAEAVERRARGTNAMGGVPDGLRPGAHLIKTDKN